MEVERIPSSYSRNYGRHGYCSSMYVAYHLRSRGAGIAVPASFLSEGAETAITAAEQAEPEEMQPDTEAEEVPSEDPEPDTEEIPVLSSSSKDKTYMSVHAITDRTSDQWQYIHESGEVKTDDRGFIICGDGYIGAALGFYFGEIGEKYIFTLSTGEELKICKVEHKAEKDTREDRFAHHDGHVIEFVIDTDAQYMQENIEENGYIFSGNFNNCPEFEGEIVKIEKVKGENQ